MAPDKFGAPLVCDGCGVCGYDVDVVFDAVEEMGRGMAGSCFLIGEGCHTG